MGHDELLCMGKYHDFKLQRLGDVADVLINKVMPPTWCTNLLLPYHPLVCRGGVNGSSDLLLWVGILLVVALEWRLERRLLDQDYRWRSFDS